MNFFDLDGGGNFWDIPGGNFFDLAVGNFWDYEVSTIVDVFGTVFVNSGTNVFGTVFGVSEESPEDVPSNIIQPQISGSFIIDGVLTAYDGFWTDGTSSRQWRKADDAIGTNASDISGETGVTYTVDSNDISLGEFIGLRVTQTNGAGSATADSPWYEIVDVEDVYFETGSQYIRITVGYVGAGISRVESSEVLTNFNLDRYNDRFNDRKYYRRNRSG